MGAMTEWINDLEAQIAALRARAEAAEARMATVADALGLAPGSDLAASVRVLRASVEATQARAEAAEAALAELRAAMLERNMAQDAWARAQSVDDLMAANARARDANARLVGLLPPEADDG